MIILVIWTHLGQKMNVPMKKEESFIFINDGSKGKTFWTQSFILCDHRNEASLGCALAKNKCFSIAS
jgi:hypothetical protein